MLHDPEVLFSDEAHLRVDPCAAPFWSLINDFAAAALPFLGDTHLPEKRSSANRLCFMVRRRKMWIEAAGSRIKAAQRFRCWSCVAAGSAPAPPPCCCAATGSRAGEPFGIRCILVLDDPEPGDRDAAADSGPGATQPGELRPVPQSLEGCFIGTVQRQAPEKSKREANPGPVPKELRSSAATGSPLAGFCLPLLPPCSFSRFAIRLRNQR